MLYTPCVEFQSVFITSNYPLKKKANLFSKGEGGRLWQKVGGVGGGGGGGGGAMPK